MGSAACRTKRSGRDRKAGVVGAACWGGCSSTDDGGPPGACKDKMEGMGSESVLDKGEEVKGISDSIAAVGIATISTAIAAVTSSDNVADVTACPTTADETAVDSLRLVEGNGGTTTDASGLRSKKKEEEDRATEKVSEGVEDDEEVADGDDDGGGDDDSGAWLAREQP
mmetsp:Transcript_32267/g.65762  ORF Transcript_32267/g.65762 Transcript_32267/m.65762 type:complete len:169 (-) Transcript_32267:332-838(-)